SLQLSSTLFPYTTLFRSFFSSLFEDVGDSEEGRLTVQSVKDRFDQEKIDISFYQRADLLEISLTQLIERNGAKSWIVYVRRDGSRDRQGADRSAHEAASARLFCNTVGYATRDVRGRHVHFTD